MVLPDLHSDNFDYFIVYDFHVWFMSSVSHITYNFNFYDIKHYNEDFVCLYSFVSIIIYYFLLLLILLFDIIT